MSTVHPLKLAYAREHPADLATYLATRGAEAINDGLDGLPPESAAAVVAKLPRGQALRTLAAHDDEVVTDWLNAAGPDHALVLVLHLESERQSRVLGAVSSRRKRRNLERLLYYPSETVGALVNPRVVRLNADMTLAEAITILQGQEWDPGAMIWIVEDNDDYLGVLDVKAALVSHSRKLPVRRLAVTPSPLQADTSLASAPDFREWLRYTELPVVDRRGRFLGTLARERLLSALGRSGGSDQGLVDGLGDMARQYFRIMGVCLDDLFSPGGRR